MNPVGDLHDEEEFHNKRDLTVGISLPQLVYVHQAFLDNNVRSPYCRGTIESKELARLIEFTMLHFRQVHLPVQFVQNVLLNDSMDHNTDEEVEEDTKQVLHPRHVISDLIPCVIVNFCNIVLEGHKQGCNWRCSLKHQSNDENHCHT